MKYMGSKARYAKYILPIILKDRQEGQYYVEPFCGGCNTLDKVENPRIGNDIHPHLICMFDAVSSGWMPPEFISEINYKGYQKDKVVDPETGYVGFALSFGGKWFGGYRRDKSGDNSIENMKTQSRRSYKDALKQFPKLLGVEFFNKNYWELDIPSNSIIYCDPPYAGTTKYSTNSFDYDKFWNWCNEQINKGHKVFVSEYNAPEGWTCVWEKEVSSSLTKDTGSKKAIERLFTK